VSAGRRGLHDVVLMWDGKARVTQEMESDLKLGTARAMPITVRSLLIYHFKNERKTE